MASHKAAPRIAKAEIEKALEVDSRAFLRFRIHQPATVRPKTREARSA